VGFFETPIAIKMELMPRLEATDKDGGMAVLRYAYQMKDGRIAQLSGCNYNEVGYNIERAVSYMSTRKRRERSYHDFVTHPKHKKLPYLSYNVRKGVKNIKENLGGETMEPESISSGLTKNREATEPVNQTSLRNKLKGGLENDG